MSNTASMGNPHCMPLMWGFISLYFNRVWTWSECKPLSFRNGTMHMHLKTMAVADGSLELTPLPRYTTVIRLLPGYLLLSALETDKYDQGFFFSFFFSLLGCSLLHAWCYCYQWID